MSNHVHDETNRDDQYDLAYWYPRLAASGVRTPRTIILHRDLDYIGLDEGRKPDGIDALVEDIRNACAEVGYPAFLRTGHTSGKHGWKNTCWVPDALAVPRAIYHLVLESLLADIIGLPLGTWAIRQGLSLDVLFHAFDGTPIAVERRVFFSDHEIACLHPYWPADAIRRADHRMWRSILESSNALVFDGTLSALSQPVFAAFDGAWSLDWARGRDGSWYAIDMAPAARSFHWLGCPNETWL